MSRPSRRIAALAVLFALAACYLIGCGGGGGAPSPPPGPPPVEIGPGPGPPAPTVAAEPGISTVAARNAPFATAPNADVVRAAALNRIDGLADDPPSSTPDLEALLADFTGWVTQQPNDAAAQAGLAAALVMAGIYNAGIDAGYAPPDIFGLFGPLTDLTSVKTAQSGARLKRMLAATCLPLPQAWGVAPVETAADRPDLTDADFSTADVQIAVRHYLLPLIDCALDRLRALRDNAPDDRTPLVELGAGEDVKRAYRGDVRALIGLLRLLKATLMQACAYQLNAGSWDWTVPLADRDGNGDGLLAVNEYLPDDPFLRRHPSRNMQDSGATLRAGLSDLVLSMNSRRPDSLLQAWASGGEDSTQRPALLEDIRELARETVTVTVTYSGAANPEIPAAASRDVRLNLSRIWDAPVDDLKELLPTLRPVSGGAWEALPRDADDFPDPTFNGLFPRPDPLIDIIVGGPDYVALSYGEIDELVIIDRR